jgi:long-chain acyl-CoA synthetase
MQGNDSLPFLSCKRSFDYLKGERPLHAYLAEYAATKPNHTAYIFYGAEMTWAQLARYTAHTAAYFIQSGVCKGNRVALFMQNCPQYIIAHYAVQSIGCIGVPLNPMYQEEEIAYGLQELEVSVLFAGDQRTESNLVEKQPGNQLRRTGYRKAS